MIAVLFSVEILWWRLFSQRYASSLVEKVFLNFKNNLCEQTFSYRAHAIINSIASWHHIILHYGKLTTMRCSVDLEQLRIAEFHATSQ